MSLFKIDSKIYGAWNVEIESDLLPNDDCENIENIQNPSPCSESTKKGGDSNSQLAKHGLKKILTFKF